MCNFSVSQIFFQIVGKSAGIAGSQGIAKIAHNYGFPATDDETEARIA